MAGLEIEIGADASELEYKIDKAQKDIDKLSKQKDAKIKIGADTGDLDKQIDAATNKLNNFKKVADSTGNTIKNFAAKTANGGNALMQFSRIAQDAPYGIIGVGNNITAFAESFSYLVKETGSAGGALKSFAASLLGTGGVLLAVSLVTTALTYMSQNGITLSDVFNKLSGTFDQARKDMQDLNAEAAKGAQAQISSVGAYVAAAKNINLSMEDRLIAVRKLQDEYPGYFGNLTKEEILNGNVAKTVRDVTAALIAKAKVAALTDRIVKLAEEEENIQSAINNSIGAQFKQYKLTKKEAFDAAVLLNKQLRGEIDLTEALANGQANNLSKAEKTALAAFKYSVTLQGLGEELRKNKADQDRLTDSIEDQTAAQIKLDKTKEKSVKQTKKITLEAVSLIKPVKSTDDQNDRLLAIMRDTLSEDIANFKTKPIELNIPIQPIVDTRAEERALIPYYKMFFEFTKNVDSLVTDSLSSTFENLGTSIGEALAQGQNVFGAIGKSLIASLGAFISDMGSLLIKYGTLAIAKGAIDKALTSGNPAITIAAGASAIAVGIALKAAGGAISSKSNGSSAGGSVSNGSTGASYNSPGSSFSGSGSSYSSGGTVVFEIAGDKLIGVLSNTIGKNNRLGTSINL